MKSFGTGMAMAATLALAAIASPAPAQSQAQSAGGERMSKGIEAYNASPQTWWVYVRDKGGIVAMYPPDGKTWATTDQFEQLISQPTDPAAGPTIIILGGTPGRNSGANPRPSCVGPLCPGDTVLQRLRGMPDFPDGSFLLKGTAVNAVFLERQ
jgi:hypothetical protein